MKSLKSISNNRVNPGEEERDRRDNEQLHKALGRIMAFGQENGWDHPVVINTINAISIGHWIEKIDAGRARAAKGVKIREKVKDSGI